jgi:hypothetical protein
MAPVKLYPAMPRKPVPQWTTCRYVRAAPASKDVAVPAAGSSRGACSIWVWSNELRLMSSVVVGEEKRLFDGVDMHAPEPATISEDGNKIEGRWEYDKGDGGKTDFDLVYTRVR